MYFQMFLSSIGKENLKQILEVSTVLLLIQNKTKQCTLGMEERIMVWMVQDLN